MWLVTVLQRERGGQVLLQQWGLLDLGNQGGVDSLLVGDSLSLDLVLGKLLVEESGLGLLGLGGLLSGEVGGVVLGHVDRLDVNLGGGGDDVTSVNSSQWDTVDLEWARHQQGVVLQVLQVHNSLASESTGQQDQHGTGHDRRTQLVWASSLSSLLWDERVWGWVPLWLLYVSI